MEERRRYRRLRMVSHLEVMFKEDGTVINAFTTNISREGIGFCTGKEIEEGKNVDVKIYFDISSDKRMAETISGEIKWVKQISRIYEAGVKLYKTDFESLPLFARHVHSL